MSWTTGPYVDQPAYQDFNCRTVGEVQRKIIARGKRNPIFRALNAKNDKDAIAAWGRDLDRILNIFNVRSANSVWRYLIASLSDGAVNK